MNFILEYAEFYDVNEFDYAYHVTSKKNLPSILENGLETRIPEDYGDSGDIEGVYLFKKLDDVENALYNWLGERIDDVEEETGVDYDEVVLKIDISGLKNYLIDSVEYEWVCTKNIEPYRISVVDNFTT